MSDFGKLNFSTSFNPTSAFPLDARCYFTDLASAEAAAAQAEEVGSTNTIYHYGMRLLVDDGSTITWYTIQRDGTLLPDVNKTHLNEFAMLTAEEIDKLNYLLMDGAPVCEPVIEITRYRNSTYKNTEGVFKYHSWRIDTSITNLSKGLVQKFEVGRVIDDDKYDPPIEWYDAALTLGDTAHESEHEFVSYNETDDLWGRWGFYVRLTYYNLLGDTKTIMAKTVNAPGVIE